VFFYAWIQEKIENKRNRGVESKMLWDGKKVKREEK